MAAVPIFNTGQPGAQPTPGYVSMLRWLAGQVGTVAIVGGLLWGYHEWYAPRPDPDRVEVAAKAELKGHVAAAGEVAKRLAAGELKTADDVADALKQLKTASASALTEAIKSAPDPAAAWAKVHKVQSGMLK